MPVTGALLKETITELYHGEIRLMEEEIVIFGLKCGDGFAHVSLHLHSQFQDRVEPQAIGVSFVFVNQDRYEYTVNHLEPGLVGEFCLLNQRNLDWSSLEMHLEEDSDKVLALYKTIGTSKRDLKLALKRDFASKLHETLFHMSDEFQTLAPAVAAFASIQTAEEHQMQALHDLPTDGTSMQ